MSRRGRALREERAAAKLPVTMKDVLFALVPSLLLVCGCGTAVVGPQATCQPRGETFRRAGRGDLSPASSYDGSKVAYVKHPDIVGIVDLNTRTATQIRLPVLLPDSYEVVGISDVQWSPYSNDRVLVAFTAIIDKDNRRQFDRRPHILDVTARSIAALGPDSSDVFTGNPGFAAYWLPESRQGEDVFLLSSMNGLSARYSASRRTLVTVPAKSEFYFLITADAVFGLTRAQRTTTVTRNGASVYSFPDSLSLTDFSVSRSGQLFAISLLENGVPKIVLGNTGGEAAGPAREIWLPDRFCMYADLEPQAEFVSETRLAVSMHRDGDSLQTLYEVSVDGDLIGPLVP